MAVKQESKSYDKFIKILNILPQVIIYLMCAIMFFINVVDLIQQYRYFGTIVMVEYKTPKKIEFPSFTICGCCIEQVVQNDSAEKIVQREMELFHEYSVKQIIQNKSFTSDMLISSCTMMMDSKQNVKNHCESVEPILQSVYDGRKCFTYLTRLNRIWNKSRDQIDNNDRYTAFINLELSFPPAQNASWSFHRDDNTLRNADIIIAIHPPLMLPTMLDTEFYRIDPGNMYEIQFTKEVTKLKEKPYRTACRKYDVKDRPRSRNECVNLCIMTKSLASHKDIKCIYYHNVISSYMLDEYWDLHSENVKFCTARNYTSYVNFTSLRRQCYLDCGRDCEEENFKTTIDVSTIETGRKSINLEANDLAKKRKSTVMIFPNREMYQEVEHESELNVFELIGYLGGHAHIWLGLSVIQLFDVFANLLRRFRYFLELARQKFRAHREKARKSAISSSTNRSLSTIDGDSVSSGFPQNDP